MYALLCSYTLFDNFSYGNTLGFHQNSVYLNINSLKSNKLWLLITCPIPSGILNSSIILLPNVSTSSPKLDILSFSTFFNF